MSAQDSENHCWCTEPANVLGQGATGMVYRGYHKTTCELVAIKCFNAKSFERSAAVQAREFQLTLRLNHPNIVLLLAAETESGTGNKILVTELCEGGSLYDFISQPENVFGLEDAEFLRVLADVAAGLKYLRQQGIVHRDLKPGNILRHLSKDGSSVYKLTDFGTARELEDDGHFMSLCGTEEYLHPDMYAAVMHQNLGTPFGAHVDLWSFGVTMYQAACGRLPFLPFGGRQNRKTMYDMISKKDSGYISGIQYQKDGPIKWENDLPTTCLLSREMRELVVPLICGVMEKVRNKAWSYEDLFREVARIVDLVPIPVFCASSCILHRFYLDKSCTLSHLQDVVAQQTNIPAIKQHFILKHRQLTNLVKPVDPITKYPTVTNEEPVILVSMEEIETFPEPGKELTLHIPSPDERGPMKEAMEVRMTFAVVIYCNRQIKMMSLTLELLKQAENIIREFVLKTFHELEIVFPYVKESQKLCLDRTNMARELFRDVGYVVDPIKKHFVDKLQSISKDFKTYHTRGANIDSQQRNLSKYVEQYQERLVEGPLLITLADYEGCEKKRCLHIAAACLSTSKRVWDESFGRGRHVGSSTSQSWMRHVARTRIKDEYICIKDLVENHCHVGARRAQRHFLAWASRCWKYLRKVNRLADEVQKGYKESESLHRDITKKEATFAHVLARVAHGIEGSEERGFSEPLPPCPLTDEERVDLPNSKKTLVDKSPKQGDKYAQHSASSNLKHLYDSTHAWKTGQTDLYKEVENNLELLQRLEVGSRMAEPPGRYTTS